MGHKEELEIHNDIVNGLSELIRNHLLNAAYQQYTPDFNVDKSDSITADGKEKAKELRRIREEFENVVTGIIFPI